MLSGGATPNDLQELLGHSDVSTAMILYPLYSVLS